MKLKQFNIFPDTIFKSGVFWNLFSFFVMGVSGLLLNVLIARYYEPWVLGVFNNVFAIFIISAQLGSLGMHQSVLRHVSVYSGDRDQSSQIIASALLLTFASSLCVTFFIYVLKTPLSHLFNDFRIKIALDWLLIGLFLFPINKVLLSVLNGFRKMRAYAIGQSLRYVFILAALVFNVESQQPGEHLSVVFSVSETFLIIILLIVLRKHIAFRKVSELTRWMSKHLAFGIRGMGSGVLNELNTRVDVLSLSLFMSMESVGIYSLVAIMVEGMSQVLMVFRVNYDPLIAKFIHSQQWDELSKMIRKGRYYIMPVMLLICGIAVLFYPIIIRLLSTSDKFHQSQLIFIILITGVVFSSGFIPFSGILQQGGYPGTQTILVLSVVLINLTGNLLLIPLWGLIGAALATAASQVAFIYILKYLAHRKIHKGII